MARREGGFSILELMIAMGIMMVITGTMFTLLNPAQGSFSAQPEVSDMQQRLRVAQDTLSRDLLMAGAGPYLGSQTSEVGALKYYFAPALPFRQGAVGSDGPGQFFTDRITLFYVPPTTAEMTLSTPLDSGATPGTLIPWYTATDCPTTSTTPPPPMCGFVANMAILVIDNNGTGNYDTFTVTSVTQSSPNQGSLSITLNRPSNATPTTYPITSKVIEVKQRTYYVNTADPTNYQLMSYDGSLNADVPVADHVVGLTFDYYGESQPPQFVKPGDPSKGTTYGPAASTVANCVMDQFGAPLLPVLGDGSNPNTLIQLTAAQLTDGPWCPDSNSANRWDADLLRIRKIGVRLRVESAADALRGPASALFTRAGTSSGGVLWVPDQEIYFQVSPRNLNLGR